MVETFCKVSDMGLEPASWALGGMTPQPVRPCSDTSLHDGHMLYGSVLFTRFWPLRPWRTLR
jgi:hypothetical protein